MQHPNDLPQKLKTHCQQSERFFINAQEAQLSEYRFKIYLEGLLHRELTNSYEQLLKAAVMLDMPKILALSDEAQNYPALFNTIREFIDTETLIKVSQDPLATLYAATFLMKTKRFNSHMMHDLINQFPAHTDFLLTQAIIHDAPVNWEQLNHTALSCAALAKKGVNVTKKIQKIYEHDKSMNTLMHWLIIDPQTALQIIPAHPVIHEQIQLLALHGDAILFSNNAHQLTNLPCDTVREAMMLMFDEQVHTREHNKQRIYDPIHVQMLCKNHPQRKTNIQDCKGRVADYWSIHGYH